MADLILAWNTRQVPSEVVGELRSMRAYITRFLPKNIHSTLLLKGLDQALAILTDKGE